MSVDKSSEILEAVYSARSNAELIEAYNNWAEAYDEDVNSYGYVIPSVLAGLLGRLVRPEDGPVLDAGAGTGLMGWIAYLMGHIEVTGIDMSPGMLEMAGKRGMYKELRQMVLGEKLDFPDNAFGAVISTGVFTLGHAPTSSFDELCRVVKPGGHILFSLHMESYHQHGFKEKLEGLQNEGTWILAEMTDDFPGLPLEDTAIMHRIMAYQVS